MRDRKRQFWLDGLTEIERYRSLPEIIRGLGVNRRISGWRDGLRFLSGLDTLGGNVGVMADS